MEAFKTIIWIINIFSSLAIIGLVLMQHGKGADAGASFGGSGSAQGVFGSAGNANFLSRMTGISAIVFFATCLALGYINANHKKGSLNFDTVKQSSHTHQAASTPVGMEAQAPVQIASQAVAGDSNNGTAAAAIAAGAGGAVAAKALNNTSDGKTVKPEEKKSERASAKAKAEKKAEPKKKSSKKPVKN